MNGQKLKVVDKFAYLGSTLSRAVYIDNEVTARITKARVAFGRLHVNVWERNRIKLDTKLKIYKTVVLTTLWYACETWTVYQRHAKRLKLFAKAVKNQVARQDSRHGGPAESRDAKHAYCLKASTANLKVDWPCYKNA